MLARLKMSADLSNFLKATAERPNRPVDSDHLVRVAAGRTRRRRIGATLSVASLLIVGGSFMTSHLQNANTRTTAVDFPITRQPLQTQAQDQAPRTQGGETWQLFDAGVTDEDYLIAEQFVRFALDETVSDGSLPPFSSEGVSLGYGDSISHSLAKAALGEFDRWRVYILADERGGYFSALNTLKEHVLAPRDITNPGRDMTVAAGSSGVCWEAKSVGDPREFADMRVISISPAQGSVGVCAADFVVRLFLANDGTIGGVTFQLGTP